jgi:hypothetical protein
MKNESLVGIAPGMSGVDLLTEYIVEHNGRVIFVWCTCIICREVRYGAHVLSLRR